MANVTPPSQIPDRPTNQPTDQPASDNQTTGQPQTDDSYVNAYQPPAGQASDSNQPAPGTPGEQSANSGEVSTDQPTGNNQSSDQPAAQPTTGQPSPATPPAESLEQQNIFDLLGVNDGTDQEKEAFLDELQQVIWEDFLENDVGLLLTDQENQQFQAILNKPGPRDDQRQEEIVQFLDGLIPNLEDVMLEKALELKEAMVHERIKGMAEFHAGQAEALAAIDEAKQLISQQRWHSAATKLNSIWRQSPPPVT